MAIFMKFCCGVLNLSNLLLLNSWLVLINSFFHPSFGKTVVRKETPLGDCLRYTQYRNRKSWNAGENLTQDLSGVILENYFVHILDHFPAELPIIED